MEIKKLKVIYKIVQSNYRNSRSPRQETSRNIWIKSLRHET